MGDLKLCHVWGTPSEVVHAVQPALHSDPEHLLRAMQQTVEAMRPSWTPVMSLTSSLRQRHVYLVGSQGEKCGSAQALALGQAVCHRHVQVPGPEHAIRGGRNSCGDASYPAALLPSHQCSVAMSSSQHRFETLQLHAGCDTLRPLIQSVTRPLTCRLRFTPLDKSRTP